MDVGVFASSSRLQDAFEGGLLRLLEEDRLGTFVLVLANASFDPALFARLRARLADRFEHLAASYREALRAARPVADPEDDQFVFLKLLALGFEHLRPTEQRRVGPWEVQFNPLRALRPPRAAGLVPKGIRADLDVHGFHFNRRFLDRELFWSGDLAGRPVALFYNKYPFVDRHGLLVPERTQLRPQFLTREDHLHAWRVVEGLAGSLPGIGLGYNAYGAFASVNHLHFQFLVRGPLPLEDPRWQHAGGTEPYPAPCEVFRGAAEAWARIAELHSAEHPYNLVYRPGRLFCLPRRRQGTYEQTPWTGGFAWYELAGGFTLCNRQDYECLTAEDLARELARAGGREEPGADASG